MTSHSDESLRAWFLGPRAENADMMERLVVEALRDHVFWRRNYHPEDGGAIREIDRRSAGYDEAVARLKQELMGLLAELKRGVPFFSGRYKGHMNYEQTIASQVGYFAAMLYNPNNVALEGSPVTTRIELDVARQLARMIGYDEATSWGHLTSGGTIANFEALWVARNIIYLPLAAYGAAQELGVDVEVGLPGGERASLADVDLWQLLNIPVDDSLDLWRALWAAAPAADVRRALESHSLSAVGYQDYARRLATAFDETYPAGVVLVAATAHYSWEKVVRALGIGSNQLVYVPVDKHYRIDPDALWRSVSSLAERRVPILSCVSVCGTTEESAVDRLDLVLEVRDRAARELGVGFHVHSDACYGGYAAAVTWSADGKRRSPADVRASSGVDWPSDEWVTSMQALAGADSISIDPHKLGYIPYPAGAIVFRDRRARELVAIDPPYLAPARGQGESEQREMFLGQYILEGSKPGAAAAAVWLSHKVLPLDERGYGRLVERTVAGARRLHEALAVASFGEFRVVTLPAPDINIVCYVVVHPRADTLERVNALNEGVYARMSLATPGANPEYIITRTRFQSPMYDGAIDRLLEQVGVCTAQQWRDSGAEGLVVLRSTVMDPFLSDDRMDTDHVAGFVAALARAAAASLDEVDPQ